MKEVQSWQQFKFGAWNVRSLSNKEADVIAEIERENEDIVVLTETKLRGNGKTILGNYVHLYSGVSYKGGLPSAGVSILIKKKHCESYLNYQAVNERIIWAELCLCKRKVVVIGAYMVDECRPKEKKDAFIDKLKEVLLNIPSDSEIIVLGDFNAHVGKAINDPVVGKFGVKETNNNGVRLKELCSELNLKIQNTFFQHQDVHKYTWYGNGTKKSLVDYCITRQKSALNFLDVLACRWLECGTDHIFLEAIVEIPFITKININSSGNKIPKYKSFLLFSKTYQAAYKNCLDTKVDINLSKTHTNTEIYEHLKEIIHTAANQILGCVEKNTFGSFLWDAEMMHLQQLRMKQITDTSMLSNTIDFSNNFDPKIKNEVWKGVCGEINGREKCKKYKVIKGILAELLNVPEVLYKTNTESVSSDQNSLLDTLKKRFTETREDLNATLCINLDETAKICFQNIDIKDIKMALDNIDYHNYTTPGGLNVNLLKFSSTGTKEVIRNLLHCILNGGEIPSEIKEAYLYGESDLNPNAEIIVLHPILNLVCYFVKRELENLEPFKRSCISCEDILDATLIMRLLMQKNVTKQKMILHCAVIDLASSYSSLPLEKILTNLQESGVCAGLTNLIRTLIIGNSVRIVKDGEISEMIKVSKGLISSCSLSPSLLRCYVSTAVKSWDNEMRDRGVMIGKKKLCFIYSNDKLILFSKTRDDLEIMMEQLIDKFDKIGITINSKIASYLGDADFKLGDELIPGKQVVDFQNYVLETNGSNEKDIDKRMHEAKTIIGYLHPCARDEMLSHRIKTQIFNSIIKVIMTFGCETWTLTEKLKKEIDATEMRYWKWCCESSSAYERMRVGQKVSAVVMLKKAARFARIMEMNSEEWVRQILDWEPEGKRKAVKPRKKWDDGIEEFISSMGHMLKSDRLNRPILKSLPPDKKLDMVI